ncbi:MAG TPA: phage tail protein [Longimicrobiaceae bacterium]|jgi:phage tail-like protein|nr:phage tail protein [Longimicrobiaceae bacterium]
MTENDLFPAHVFRFRVDFAEDRFGSDDAGTPVALCSGAFSEVTGLEATMEPKAIKEGGKNYSVNQRAGPVTFATVVLKRGMTTTRDLWNWWDLVAGGKYAFRLAATITMLDHQGDRLLAWKLEKALPVKFKAADLNAKGTEVGIEELHLAHEGLRLVKRAGKDAP